MGGLFIDIYVEYLIRVMIHSMNLLRGRSWTIVKATVLSAESSPGLTYGCPVATACYEYVVRGEKYGNEAGKPFISRDSSKEYAAQLAKAATLTVRVNPKDPTKSVPLWPPHLLP